MHDRESTTKGLDRPGDDQKICDAAMPNAADAVEAVRRACGAGANTIVEPIAELSPGIDLRDGEVLAR